LESGHGKFESHTLDVSIRAMQRLIGQEIPKETILKILVALEIRVIGDTGDKLLLEVPPYRVDVKEQADIVEEVLRIYGLDNIELPDQMLLRADTDELQPLQIVKRRVSEALVAFGFQETLHNSLHKSDWYEKDDIVDILNPLSQDLDIMRNSAMPAGLETISRNLKHRVGDVKIFEFGKTYHKRDARYFERQFLSFWISGKDRPENWQQSTREADIFTLKEGLYRVFRLLGLEVTEKVKDDQLLFKSGKKNLGFMQTVSRKWLKNFDIDQAVFYAELDWDAILQLKDNKKEKLRDVPRFPSVRRDLALLVDKDQVFEKIKRSTINVNPQWIQEVGLFDVYEGKGLPEGKISYAIKVLIQSDEKTLTDAEVDKLMDKVLKVLEKETGAVLRQ
jgi:phenylalanyl-tRNA synthetase beta chain